MESNNGFKFERLTIWQKAMDLGEVLTCLYKAKLRKYISEEEFKNHYDFNLMNMSIAFRNKI